MIQNILVLGGGSAGLIAALTLKRKLPALQVKVVRSPELGVIGVGEGTTVAFPRLLFSYLKIDPKEFYAEAEPTWKLGIKFIWGKRPAFYYTFEKEYEQRFPELRQTAGYFHDDHTEWVGHVSAFMAHDKAFPRNPDGTPKIHSNHAFHVENRKLVACLESLCRRQGVVIEDGTMSAVETGPVRCAGHEEMGVTAITLENGQRLTADLFIDASGFRSELLSKALKERYVSYDSSLFCDRAVIGGWPRTHEPIKPYTVAETMDAGWCWQIEHENWINRGYVYSSKFISDEAALAELLAKNPQIANEPRVVKFRSGRCERNWVGNVVGIGNSVGFVEPLEATAIQVICVESSTLADCLVDSFQQPTPSMQRIYNFHNGQQWDDIRDFLAVHYAFNDRLDTEFWRACRSDTNLAGAAPVVEWYRENGPSVLVKGILIPEQNSFGFDGFLALLVGQRVPYDRKYVPKDAEIKAWNDRCRGFAMTAKAGMSVGEGIAVLRKAGWYK